MKYIMIFEDDTAYQSDDFTNDDKQAVNDGILEVIRVSDLKSYYQGHWTDLPPWQRGQ